jgi:hypothetical protein
MQLVITPCEHTVMVKWRFGPSVSGVRQGTWSEK